MRHTIKILCIVWLGWLVSACSPSVGSDAWCEMMKEKPKGEWSANEAADFAKHCVLK